MARLASSMPASIPVAEAVGIKIHKDTRRTRRNSRVKEEHNLRSERDAHARKRVRVNGPQRAASKSQLQFRAERTRAREGATVPSVGRVTANNNQFAWI